MSAVLSIGLVVGSIYGLVALGLSLIYKKSRVLNFAHGEIGMVPPAEFEARQQPISAA